MGDDGLCGSCIFFRLATDTGRNACCNAGAQLISVANDDANKTFGAVLRTPVENSKGIPHILEHSVLCGSRKYPIKVRPPPPPFPPSSWNTVCCVAVASTPSRCRPCLFHPVHRSHIACLQYMGVRTFSQACYLLTLTDDSFIPECMQ